MRSHVAAYFAHSAQDARCSSTSGSVRFGLAPNSRRNSACSIVILPRDSSGPSPSRARNRLRARNSRVDTAPSLMPSWRAISRVEYPMITCRTSGSRCSCSSSKMALRTSCTSSGSRSCCSAQALAFGGGELVDVHGGMALALVEPRVFAARDGQQPRFGRLVVFQRVQRSPRTQQSFLHDFLGNLDGCGSATARNGIHRRGTARTAPRSACSFHDRTNHAIETGSASEKLAAASGYSWVPGTSGRIVGTGAEKKGPVSLPALSSPTSGAEVQRRKGMIMGTLSR